MDIGLLLQEKSWVGFIVYILIKELWPFFRDKLYPAKVAEEHMLRDRRREVEERTLKNEERSIISIEAMSLAIQQMALVITSNNERLSTLTANFTSHSGFVTSAVADMREKIALHAPRGKIK